MTDELIARLAAANPVPREGPELPSLAPSTRRRIFLRVAIVAAAAVAAVVAVLAAPQSHSGGVLGEGPGGASAAILTRMEAAIGSGQIMHVVFEGPTGTHYVDLRTGKRAPAVLSEELWSNRHGYRLHLVVRVNGRVVGDLSPGDHVGAFQGPNDPAFLSLWTGYHAALENKYAPAVLGGRGTVDGHSVVWVRFPLWYNTGGPTEHGRPNPRSFPTALAQTKLALDARTFKPILERTYEGGRRFDTRISLVEAIPYRPPELYRRLGPKLFDSMSPGHPFGGHPFAGLTRREKNALGLGRNPHRLRSRGVVPAPWLTAGNAVAGLGFRHVSRLLSQPLDQVGGLPLAWRGIYRAVRLVYKSPGGLTTRIDETFRPADPRPWKGLPRGSIEIQPGESVTKSGAHRLWTGYMVKRGVYITISTPAGEQALLKIARALHPVRK